MSKETTQWYAKEISEVLDYFKTSDTQGLSENEVELRKSKNGLNEITQKKKQSQIVLFFSQFNQPLIYILLVTVCITAFLNEWVDASVIFGVVLVNSIIGYLQEAKALKAINALAKSMSSESTVLRDGKRKNIPSANLTLGDIVFLHSGDKVPADLRMINTKELQIDESALTGESLPSSKNIDILSHNTLLGDRRNTCFSSTLVTYGSGIGVVCAIGNETEIGKINTMISNADVLSTPLTIQIAKFSSWLLYVILAMASLTFIIGYIQGGNIFDLFMASVALSVGAIPEGLPAALTITLAIGVSKMAKRNAIILKLPAVETMGSISVICSDKTGTLTQNQMTVQEIYSDNKLYTVTGVGYEPNGDFLYENTIIDNIENHNTLKQTLICGLLCNNSALLQKNNNFRIEGDPTEGALIVASEKIGIFRDELNTQYKRIDDIPFESKYQYMATLHIHNSKKIIYVKGSAESILSRCSQILINSEPIPLAKDEINAKVSNMAKKGLRVLAFAYKVVDSDHQDLVHADLSNDLIFLGFQGMIDPPRPEAIDAIKACHQAGINVKMITGDHQITAFAIAKQIGIVGKHETEENNLLNGSELSQIKDSELISKAKKINVFARVAPEDKLRLVKALQSNGESIAMTGDGVNDAPALRQANIGIAMGITGTDVAKETADMVLTDDNFATIRAAIEEGRGVYDNLIKFLTWTLPTNFGEGLIILVAVIAGTALPILPVQILWINMTTAILLGLMLAFEPIEPDIMKRNPRPSKEAVLSKILILRIAIVGTLLLIGSYYLFEWSLAIGKSDAVARTMAVNVFVLGELFYLFNCRSLSHSLYQIGLFSNPLLIFGVIGMIVLQYAYTELSFMNTAFQSSPLTMMEWLYSSLVGVVIYFVIEFEKIFRIKVLKSTKYY